MDEDVKDDGTAETAATGAAPAAPAPTPDPAIAAMQSQIAALNDTVAAALAARNVAAPGGSGIPGDIPPQLRQALRQKGLSDADITHNAPLIMPFVELFAPELIALVESRVGGVDERLTAKEMEDDAETYPYARGLRNEIKAVLAEAKKANQPMSRVAAYHAAVSTNIEKVKQLDSQRRAESAGADASALSGLGHRTTASASARAGRPSDAKSAADLAAMSREDRLKFYDKHGDSPLH